MKGYPRFKIETASETATILAALRLFQETRNAAEEMADHFLETPPLTATEIDEVCERINCSFREVNP